MPNKNNFSNWLKNDPEIKITEKTIDVYIRAVSTISKDMLDSGYGSINIYDVNMPQEIDDLKREYLKIDELEKKNKKEHRVYTSALKWYKKFLESGMSATTSIPTEEKEDEFEKSSISDLKYEKKHKGEQYIKEGQKYWKRDKKVVDNILGKMNYTCEENREHCYFKSKATGKNYVEGHHLVPMEFQDDFECSLDVEANVVSLCVVCHKKLHLASIEDKKEILEKLYKSREANLKKSGIQITLQELINLYSKE